MGKRGGARVVYFLRNVAGETVTFESRHRRKDGTTFPVEVRIRPFDRDGETMGLSIARDITRRRQAEAARREADERFRAFMDHTPALAWINDEAGTTQFVNAAWTRAFGHSPADLLARPIRDTLPPHPVADYLESDRRVLESGVARQTLETGPREDGTPGRYLVWKFPLAPAPDGRRQVGGVAIDVTDRVTAEEALRESERRFRELADAIPQIVWIAAPDGAITHVNARTTAYTGVPAEGLLGWAWAQVVHPDDLPRAAQAWEDIRSTATPRPVEFRIRAADGTYRWHINRQVPVWAGGVVSRWYGTCTDIDDQKRVEAALAGSNRLLGRVAVGAAFGDVLDECCRLVEVEIPGSICSILLLGPDRRLRLGAAPGLPAEYNRAIDTGAPDPAGKAAEFCRRIDRGPFTLLDVSVRPNPLYPTPMLTLGGVRVCEDTGAVLDADGAPIPGLFSAGRTAIGICSESYVSGLSIADCVFAGRRAGASAAAEPPHPG